jgi:TolA-binding protein
VEVQNRVDSLRNEVMTIDEDWQEQRAEEVRKEEMSRIAVEITLNRINEMLMQLSGNVAESQTKISEISQKTGLISSQMAERARQDSLVATMKELERVDLFGLAKSNFEKGNFALSIGDFDAYIQQYPDSEEAKEALFLKAEANLALDSLGIAETLFKQYYSENRDGQSACSALYKMGLIYDKQEKPKSREAVWGQLNKQCPDSPEAKLLKENQKK